MYCKSHFEKIVTSLPKRNRYKSLPFCAFVIIVDVTATTVQNNETAAMFMYPKNHMGIKFSCKNFLLFQETCLATDHVSENDLYLFYLSTSWSMRTSLTFQSVIRIR